MFAPLGFGDWRVSTALITGFMAKESVVSTLTILFGSSAAFAAALTPAQAAPLLVFCLLYTPCVAAVASVKRELGGKWAAIMVVNQCVTAWLCALVMRLILLAICLLYTSAVDHVEEVGITTDTSVAGIDVGQLGLPKTITDLLNAANSYGSYKINVKLDESLSSTQIETARQALEDALGSVETVSYTHLESGQPVVGLQRTKITVSGHGIGPQAGLFGQCKF